MYRPAQGGNITAKIKCVTYPQMATVRTKLKSSDIVVSGGKGAYKSLDKLHTLAYLNSFCERFDQMDDDADIVVGAFYHS